MNPKDGKAGAPVSPVAPEAAREADNSRPGQVTRVGGTAATAGSAAPKKAAKPHRPPKTAEEKKRKTSWVEIQMIDEDQRPVPGLRYRLTLPDGTVAEGTLSDQGLARVDGIEPGTCQLTFPDLDQAAWESA